MLVIEKIQVSKINFETYHSWFSPEPESKAKKPTKEKTRNVRIFLNKRKERKQVRNLPPNPKNKGTNLQNKRENKIKKQ
jgi:hypothetical protein